MFAKWPVPAEAWTAWRWPDLEPYYHDLQQRPLTAQTMTAWLADWSRLSEVVDELSTRLYLATAQDTTDEEAKRRFHRFWRRTFPTSRPPSNASKRNCWPAGWSLKA